MINVLIVEDEETNAKILNFYFTEYFKTCNIEKFNINISSNGWEALGMTSVENYDIIFLDVMMPKCDGFKVLNTIRLLRKDQKQPYICMVTGLGKEKHKLLFKLKGANSYVIKPFEKKIIIKILDKFMTQKANKEKQQTIDDIINCFSKEAFEDFYEESESDNLIGKEIKNIDVSATDFLKEYVDIEYIVDNICSIDILVEDIIDNFESQTYYNYIKDINLTFDKYIILFNSFSDFYELASALYLLNQTLENLSFYNMITKLYIWLNLLKPF
jgi:DNA-binding response OmpR family regulator